MSFFPFFVGSSAVGSDLACLLFPVSASSPFNPCPSNKDNKYLFVDAYIHVRWINEASIFATEESITASIHFLQNVQNNFKNYDLDLMVSVIICPSWYFCRNS